MPRKPRHLSDPAVMLETLKLAYQSVLDGLPQDRDAKPRLTIAQEKELGRRLARYWLMKEPAVPTSIETAIQGAVDEIVIAAHSAHRAIEKGVQAAKDELGKRR